MIKYAPEVVQTVNGTQPVTGVRSLPPNGHPHSPIKNELRALELVTPSGSRWYGCKNAYINSQL